MNNNSIQPDNSGVYDWSIHLIDPKEKDAKWGLNIIQRYKPICFPFYTAFYGGARSYDVSLIHQYATGTQPASIYRALFDPIEQKASYMGVNFNRVPVVIPKFRQVMADQIIKIPVQIVATATDPAANSQRGKDKERLAAEPKLNQKLASLSSKIGYDQPIKANFSKKILKTPLNGMSGGMDTMSFDLENDDELQLYMDAYYSMDVEVAYELAIQGLNDQNQIEETKKSWVYDAIDYGCAAGRAYCSDYTGLPKTEYLDVRNVLIPYTERRDAKNVAIWMYTYMFSLNECIEKLGEEMTPDLLREMYKWAVKTYGYTDRYGMAYSWEGRQRYNKLDFDAIKVPMTYFEFQSPNCEVYEESKTKNGKSKIKKKDITYQASENPDKKRNEYWAFCVYKGYYLQGLEKVFKFGLLNNMLRVKGREQMTPYSLIFYLMDERSMVEKMIAHEDNIVIAWLKIQQMLINSKPPGYFWNWDVMSDIVVGDGGKITGVEMAKMFQQTGSSFYKSINEAGEGILANPNAPHMEAKNGLPDNFMSLWESIRQEMQMIRDEIGLNEFTDASSPPADALVGIQKNAVYSSNAARQYLTDGIRNMIEDSARYTALLISDVAQYNKAAFEKIKDIVGRLNGDVIDSMDKMYLNQIGIKLRDELTEQQKGEIRQLILREYGQGKLDLNDVLLIYFIDNYKLAARLFAIKSKKKTQQMMQMGQAELAAQQKTEQDVAQLKILLAQIDAKRSVDTAEMTGKYNLLVTEMKETGDLNKKVLQEITKLNLAHEKMGHDHNLTDKQNVADLQYLAQEKQHEMDLKKQEGQNQIDAIKAQPQQPAATA